VLLCACYLAIGAVRRFAIRRQLLDIPNARSSHSVPVPRGGGLVIVTVTLFAAAIVAVQGPTPALVAYLAGGLIMATLGLADDVRSLPSTLRLAAQSAVAVLVLAAAGWWREVELPLVGLVHLGLLGPALAFFWIVGFTNAFNFMDGIDGIAGVQGLLAGVGWAMAAWLGGQPEAAIIGAALAISSGGFLLHNWSPARIFMGDVGSAFVGFTLATLPFLLHRSPEAPLLRVPLAAALVVWPFVFDALYTFGRRALRGEPVLSAHRSHLYQRMVVAGATHGRVALLYAGLAVVGGLLAKGWLLRAPGADAGIALGLPLLAILLVGAVRAREGAPAGKRDLSG
jgi:UDP-N-acetylmuramyl pentapeptide phosphotransferase/UDP-N-acetylglucosamine-1-phosphate transferase